MTQITWFGRCVSCPTNPSAAAPSHVPHFIILELSFNLLNLPLPLETANYKNSWLLSSSDSAAVVFYPYRTSFVTGTVEQLQQKVSMWNVLQPQTLDTMLVTAHPNWREPVGLWEGHSTLMWTSFEKEIWLWCVLFSFCSISGFFRWLVAIIVIVLK